MANYGRREVSSLLELEAAEFFKLDIGHMNFGLNKSMLGLGRNISTGRTSTSSSCVNSPSERQRAHRKTVRVKMQRPRDRSGRARSNENSTRRELAVAVEQREKAKHQKPRTQVARGGDGAHQKLCTKTMQHDQCDKSPTKPLVARRQQISQRAGHRLSPVAHSSQSYNLAACSSASSTNSLPSISSSPSVSPSLVCPHLSLDDILTFRQDPHGSPHTVGLCPRCRLDPPPNIHSPMSPHFMPHHHQNHYPIKSHNNSPSGARGPLRVACAPGRLKRGNSDQQWSLEARVRRRARTGAMAAKQKSDLRRGRDDSLDYCLAPAELRRMQMSPSLRNSVEFIRRNSVESGRVVRIYKNGQPFEKPLRICILRDEFNSLNHLLDHVNSRLLVPNGARFLFHLDGQPVYSVHELKHDSVYVVSGSRQYDYRTSEVLKSRQLEERQARESKLLAKQETHQPRNGAQQGGERKRAVGGGHEQPSQARQAQKVLGDDDDDDDDEGGGGSGRRNASRAADRARFEPGVSGRRRMGGGATSRGPLESRHAATDAAPEATSSKQRRAVARRVGGDGPAGGRRNGNKFSRYDESTGFSSSGLNASTQSIATASDEPPPVRVTRAKSELSALPPRKPKKNVTFMDTGRGSSPAINDNTGDARQNSKTSSEAAPDGSRQRPPNTGESKTTSSSSPPRGEIGPADLSTSEIGIQVSDSIDGFLIDLPVALPAKGDDSNLVRSRGVSRAAAATRANNGRASGAKAGAPSRRPKQIVTITERQLSLEEMNKLEDLSAGDHHHEVTIKWDTPPEGEPSGPESEADDKGAERAPEVVPDRKNTIAIGADPRPQEGPSVSSIASASSKRANEIEKAEDEGASGKWQYPGGREKSATPTERPVSQSGPSETVHARVTTPTPSLSTGGDNNSLAMSYETISQSGERLPAAGPRTERLRATPGELPAKSRLEVTGKLVSGLDKPARNFRLAWVNGFSINDLYPENTFNAAQEWAAPGGRASGSTSPSARLTPAYVGAAHQGAASTLAGRQRQSGANSFKPSERYHNWICHSRKHDELLYPAGTLVVLWCRWTNEQRYYARHTSNVTALALATLDLDLAASAQVCDLNERPPVASKIHLWSLTSLNTLLVVQDDHFRSKLIFSLRLRNTKSTGCDLSIAARDEKQLLLFELNRKLPGDARELASGVLSVQRGSENAPKSASEPQPSPALMMTASRPLQSTQLPLFLLRVPNLNGESREVSGQQPVAVSSEPIISFGRRHFHIWSSDPRQRKLEPMQGDHQRSAKFVELIGAANCLCRLSPSEFLLGDSEGNVALLLIKCHANLASGAFEVGVSSKTKRPAARAPITGPSASSRYSLEVINLLGPGAAGGRADGKPAAVSASQTNAAITSLVRVTGSLFMSADATCTIRFWKIKRAVRGQERRTSVPTVRLSSSSLGDLEPGQTISCEQVSSISLPPDLAFICTLILAQYNLRESLVEFYVVSTSNTILFGAVKLPSQYTRPGRAGTEQRAASQQVNLLANSSLSVVYEGHETSASSLVADFQLERATRPEESQYFTCSLDCRVCKWQGKQLAWKSLLPSSCASLAVHPTGSVLAVGSLDGTVYILDKLSGLLISYFPLTPVRINCLAYSRDGSLLTAACANGSIFMLPVYERGLKYKKVSIFQSPHPVVSLQFSLDNRYMLTSVTHGAYQELILWDLPNFRYLRDNVKLAADRIRWFDSICSGSEDVRAIWENANLAGASAVAGGQLESDARRAGHKRPVADARRADGSGQTKREPLIVNLSCHRLIKAEGEPDGSSVVASDTRGYLRLFRYPCYDIQQGFYAVRISSSAVNCCRFLHPTSSHSRDQFVSTSLDGSICLWVIE